VSRRSAVIDQVGGIMTREGFVFGTDDEGTSYRLLFDSAAVYVDFQGEEDDPIVQLNAPLVMKVPLEGQRSAILARLNELNNSYRYIKVYLEEDVIVASYAIPGLNLDGGDFTRAMEVVVALSEMLDDTLMIEFGGERSVDILQWDRGDEEDGE
jgi:Putative bacterial sensory transduction regulator